MGKQCQCQFWRQAAPLLLHTFALTSSRLCAYAIAAWSCFTHMHSYTHPHARARTHSRTVAHTCVAQLTRFFSLRARPLATTALQADLPTYDMFRGKCYELATKRYILFGDGQFQCSCHSGKHVTFHRGNSPTASCMYHRCTVVCRAISAWPSATSFF